MGLVVKEVTVKKSLPKPDFDLGRWVRIFPKKNEEWQEKTGYIVGYKRDEKWMYWVRVTQCDGQPIPEKVVGCERSEITAITQLVPHRPSLD